jgi:hypothetical protein
MSNLKTGKKAGERKKKEDYSVSVSDGEGTWYNCYTNFWLNVPAGSTSMTQDFTVFGS